MALNYGDTVAPLENCGPAARRLQVYVALRRKTTAK